MFWVCLILSIVILSASMRFSVNICINEYILYYVFALFRRFRPQNIYIYVIKNIYAYIYIYVCIYNYTATYSGSISSNSSGAPTGPAGLVGPLLLLPLPAAAAAVYCSIVIHIYIHMFYMIVKKLACSLRKYYSFK